MLLIDASIIFACIFVLRMAFRLYHDPQLPTKAFALAGYSGDGMTHLYMTESIRQHQGRIPDSDHQFLLSGPSDYPLGFHKLHAWLSRRLLERIEWMVTPAWEAAHAAVAYAGAHHLLTDAALLGGKLDSAAARPVAMMAAVGMMLTPYLIRDPARSSVYGERAFGFLWANATLYAVVLFAHTFHPGWLAGAAVAFTVTAVSSKFGVQAVVFVCLALAALRMDPLPVLALPVIMLAAAVLSRGYALRVLRGTIRHSRHYRNWIVHVHAFTRSFSLRQFVDAARLLRRGRLRDAWRMAATHPVMRILPEVPWLLFLAWFLSARPDYGGSSTEMKAWLEMWALAAVLVTTAILADALKFLGEAERYLEYGLFPMALLGALVAWQGGMGLVVWLTIVVYSVGRQLRTILSPTLISLTTPPGAGALITALKRIPPTTFVAIPGRLCFPVCYETRHRALWVLANMPDGHLFQDFQELIGPAGSGIYPYPAPERLRANMERHGVELLVVSKAELADVRRGYGIDYDFTGWPVLMDNAAYRVYGPVRPAEPERDGPDFQKERAFSATTINPPR
ncbi:hypothetical protein [Azospirillum agricola]|uniref:hypothetical protein n=1 Tax=Azospirillum agricola TaxID=1720247 RepID=UPI000A0F371C|nr:hypothetical protein [Azospirillum agricola]SMH41613.1 hypothetical protein SAMN02982994_1750 [Azospirillum lipoferum]